MNWIEFNLLKFCEIMEFCEIKKITIFKTSIELKKNQTS